MGTAYRVSPQDTESQGQPLMEPVLFCLAELVLLEETLHAALGTLCRLLGQSCLASTHQACLLSGYAHFQAFYGMFNKSGYPSRRQAWEKVPMRPEISVFLIPCPPHPLLDLSQERGMAGLCSVTTGSCSLLPGVKI